MIAWLSLEALRIWTRARPRPTLVGPIGHAAFPPRRSAATTAPAYRACGGSWRVGEARGYEPGPPRPASCSPPSAAGSSRSKTVSPQAQRAREGLIAGGDLAYAGYTYQLSVPYLSTARQRWTTSSPRSRRRWPSCAGPATSRPASGWTAYRWLTGVLRGETRLRGGRGGSVDRYADDPPAPFYAHLSRAIAAADLRRSGRPDAAQRRGDAAAAGRRRLLSRPRVARLLRGAGPRRPRPAPRRGDERASCWPSWTS